MELENGREEDEKSVDEATASDNKQWRAIQTSVTYVYRETTLIVDKCGRHVPWHISIELQSVPIPLYRVQGLSVQVVMALQAGCAVAHDMVRDSHLGQAKASGKVCK